MRSPPRLSSFVLLSVTALLSLLLMYSLFGHAVIGDAYHARSLPVLNRMIGHRAEHPLEFYFNKVDNLVLYLATVWLALAAAWGVALHRLARPARTGDGWFDLLVFAGCAGAFYVFLARYGAEREWAPIGAMLDFAANPPFLHRVMLVVPARALQALFPALTDRQVFLCSQMLAALLALWAVRRFAGLFIRRDLRFIAQLLLLAMWAPTVRYYTFYDIGILFVVSFCLYHLFRNEPVPYLLMLVLGTFNHETTLFLILLSPLVLWGRMARGALVRFVLLQLALYAAVRAFLFFFLPAEAAWEGGKLPYNLFLLAERPGELLRNLGPTLAWFALAATGWRSAGPALRRCLLILPFLLVMTMLVGQLHEARQFDAFIPVAVAMIVSRIAAATGALPEPSALGTRPVRPASTAWLDDGVRA